MPYEILLSEPMNTTNIQTPRLNRVQKLRAKQLLYMEYKASEISEILGIHIDTVYRSLIPAGCPHRRDERNNIWIIGTELVTWLQKLEKPKNRLDPDQALCLHCNRAVDMQPPLTIRPTSRVLELVTGTCPICGTSVNRARARQAEATCDNTTD